MNKEIVFRIKKMTKEADDLLFGTKDHDYNSRNEFINLDIVDYFPYGKFSVMHDIIKKVNRIQALLIAGKDPSNEHLRDSFIDLINYTRIGLAILEHKGVINNAKETKNGN